jgi:hypothetical protein
MGTFEAAEKAAKSKKGEKVVVSTKPTIVATTGKAIIKKTKRQRRKDEQKGDKNKWLIQHPKIQSMEHRQLIYVKDAGLNETKAEKKQLPIDPKLDLMSPEVKFGRMLAGTDQRKRHAAVKKLKAYLKARCDIGEVGAVSGGISELDLLKLWKSLWYTLYMADKKAVQDELSKHVCKLLWCVVGTEEEDECAGQAYLEMIEAEAAEDADGEDDDDEYDDVTMTEIENTLEEEKNSASDDDDDVKDDSEESGHGIEDSEEEQEIELDNVNIPHCRGAHLVSLFVRTFFRTIRRDWHTMDKYRVDKFYTLIRTMMSEIYEYMAVRGWNYGIVLLLNDAIFDEILKQPPNGLRYHLIDLCLEELAKVNAKAAIPLTEATFLDVLEPFFGLCQTGTSTHDDTVQSRVMDGVLDNFLENYSIVSERALPKDDDDDDDGDNNNKNESCTANIFDQVHVKTVAEFIFALGSDPATSDKYRKSLYEMHKKFMRRLKEVGIDVEIGTEDDDMEGEYNQFLDEEVRDDSEGGCRGDDCGHDHGHDHDHVGGGDIEDEQPAETSIELEKETKASKKNRKKKKRKSDEIEAAPVATPEKMDEKKSRKKKKTKDIVSPSKSTSADEDEEVVITLTEQQDAKKKDKKAKKAKLEKEQQEDSDNEELTHNSKGSRRVSFGKKNRAKSHKASVKATRIKLETPHSLRELTPVKGILPKEFKYSSNSKTKKSSTKARRNKATSYF